MPRGDVVWVTLPQVGGREQAGRRPAVIVGPDDGPTIPIVPCSTQIKATRFDHTLAVQPTAQNGLAAESVLLVFQITAADPRRIGEKLGSLNDEDHERLNDALRQLLGLAT